MIEFKTMNKEVPRAPSVAQWLSVRLCMERYNAQPLNHTGKIQFDFLLGDMPGLWA